MIILQDFPFHGTLYSYLDKQTNLDISKTSWRIWKKLNSVSEKLEQSRLLKLKNLPTETKIFSKFAVSNKF